MNRTMAAPFFGTCALLVAILPFEWLPDAAPPPVKQAAAPRPASASASDAEPKDTDDWAETVLRRPLFTVGRKPPKSSGGGHLVANTGLPRLAGIMITPSGKRAIFAPDGGKPLVLGEGGALDDATVRTIKFDRVVVTGPKGEQVLWPTYDHSRTGQPATTLPAFPQPGFNGGGPTPGFGPQFPGRPNFPMQPQMPQPPPPQGDPGDGGDDAGDASGPATPAPGPVPAFPGQQVPAFPRE